MYIYIYFVEEMSFFVVGLGFIIYWWGEDYVFLFFYNEWKCERMNEFYFFKYGVLKEVFMWFLWLVGCVGMD